MFIVIIPIIQMRDLRHRKAKVQKNTIRKVMKNRHMLYTQAVRHHILCSQPGTTKLCCLKLCAACFHLHALIHLFSLLSPPLSSPPLSFSPLSFSPLLLPTPFLNVFFREQQYYRVLTKFGGVRGLTEKKIVVSVGRWGNENQAYMYLRILGQILQH